MHDKDDNEYDGNGVNGREREHKNNPQRGWQRWAEDEYDKNGEGQDV